MWGVVDPKSLALAQAMASGEEVQLPVVAYRPSEGARQEEMRQWPAALLLPAELHPSRTKLPVAQVHQAPVGLGKCARRV